MSIYVPDYYADFHCIAQNCKHTCCAGWEIDIDPDSLKRFRTLQGEPAQELNQSICEEGTPHFRLTDEERCPMLAPNGLCRMILAWGEDSLCQICRDHPRFRNYWTGRTEIGLGLVCEEAARLILTRNQPMKLVLWQGSGSENLPEKEKALLAVRNRLLRQIREEGPLARLQEYLIYRHIADALYDGRLMERIAFVKRAYLHIANRWQDGNTDTLVELCRQFSDKVEYDSDVLEAWISGNKRG